MEPHYDGAGRPANDAARDLEAQIEREIAEHNGSTFLPDEWRALRREGYRADQIDYDMTHIFR